MSWIDILHVVGIGMVWLSTMLMLFGYAASGYMTRSDALVIAGMLIAIPSGKVVAAAFLLLIGLACARIERRGR